MGRAGEEVEEADGGGAVERGEGAQVSGEGIGSAGDVGDGGGEVAQEALAEGGGEAVAGRIDDPEFGGGKAFGEAFGGGAAVVGFQAEAFGVTLGLADGRGGGF